MKYIRKSLDNVAGYTPGEQTQHPNLIKLNTNENPYPPSPKVMQAIADLTAKRSENIPTPSPPNFEPPSQTPTDTQAPNGSSQETAWTN